MEDICYKTDNDETAIADENGAIKGVAAGDTMITVYTRDNRFKACCAITVTDDASIALTHLKLTKQYGELIDL